MKTLCVIPSRIGSTRLPRKPLLHIQGKPMVQQVYEKASACSFIDKVVVATDSQEIAEVITKINGNVELTSTNIKTGTDRVASVASMYPDMDVVINLQGDEPFIKPVMLEQLISPFASDGSINMATLAFPILEESEFSNPNIVKVILDKNNDAIIFSRAAIPHKRVDIASDKLPVFHHMGLYAFRRDFLLEYTKLEQTPLEKVEALEQLRAIENGYKIKVSVTGHRTLEINNAEELAAAQSFVS